MNNAKSKGGRPKTYEGEKNIRVSIAIRPRYRQAIELISKDRNTSLNEVVEFAIAKLASQYEIEGKMVLDYVRPCDESKKRIFNAYETKSFLTTASGKILPSDWAVDFLERFDKLPKNLRTSRDIFTAGVLKEIGDPWFISNLFDIDLMDAIVENWKEGRLENEVVADIKMAIKDADEERIELAKKIKILTN